MNKAKKISNTVKSTLIGCSFLQAQRVYLATTGTVFALPHTMFRYHSYLAMAVETQMTSVFFLSFDQTSNITVETGVGDENHTCFFLSCFVITLNQFQVVY